MKLNYVQQKHKYGCSAACAAMILGKPYDEVVALFEHDFDKCGLKNEVIRDYITDHGFSLIEKRASGYMDIETMNKRMIAPFADVHLVCAMPFKDSKNAHAIVMNNKGEIFDPDRPDNKKWDYYSVFQVLGFFQENKNLNGHKQTKRR